MASLITKKELDHLAELGRIKLTPDEEEKLLHDLPNILGHFEELKQLDTSHIPPVITGTALKNAFREDGERMNTNQGKGVEAFPKKEQGFLRIPPVFE